MKKKKKTTFDRLMETNELATYNAERARGIMHEEWWQERMEKLQYEFDLRQQQGLDTESE